MKIDNSFIGTLRGRLTAIGPAFAIRDGSRHRTVFVAQCDCGEVFVSRVDASRSKSCGCLQRESAVALGHKRCGDRSTNFKDGRTQTRLYKIWKSMHARCKYDSSINWHNYGGRGISVCQEWHDFVAFKNWSEAHGYRAGLQLDRKKNALGYSPDNCRWVTRKVNSRNTRFNVVLNAFGESRCIAEWAEDPRAGASETTIRKRIEMGWSAERAISSPVAKTNSSRVISAS